jgi:hypothetical protein
MATCTAGQFVSVVGPNTAPHVNSPYVVQVRNFCVANSMALSAVQVNRFGVVSCHYGTLATVAVHP